MTENDVRNSYSFPVIGRVLCCYKEKFGVPRQPGLAPAAKGEIEFLPPYDNPEAFYGLEQCSHVWLQFVFHQNLHHQWRPRVRPPRLGGNKTLGVFATRSPVRPAALGLSVVKLERIETEPALRLHFSGGDLVDGTPIIDIKPYVPYVDRIDEAQNAIAEAAPQLIPVTFCASAEDQLRTIENRNDVAILITQILRQDPRPSYQRTDISRIYGMKLLDYNVKWRYLASNSGDLIEVVAIETAVLPDA